MQPEACALMYDINRQKTRLGIEDELSEVPAV